MKRASKDRRREHRVERSGAVEIVVDNGLPVTIRARLIDVSPGGFRAAHTHFGLRAGDEVRFKHGQSQGTAKAVWSRVTRAKVETGFLVN